MFIVPFQVCKEKTCFAILIVNKHVVEIADWILFQFYTHRQVKYWYLIRNSVNITEIWWIFDIKWQLRSLSAIDNVKQKLTYAIKRCIRCEFSIIGKGNWSTFRVFDLKYGYLLFIIPSYKQFKMLIGILPLFLI